MQFTLNQPVARTLDEDRLRLAARRGRPPAPDRPPPRVRRGAARATARLAARLDRDAAQRALAA